MNKYQKALDNIQSEISRIAYKTGRISLLTKYIKDRETLQELIDKEAPMKPGQDETGTYVCGRCKEYSVTSEGNYSREYERCTMANCGQVVDWIDIE